MKNKSYQMTMLLDFYGDLLTERQREFFDLYYNEDFSLSEISENNGITRQGVRDTIVRAESILTNFEEKTGIVKRFLNMKSQLEIIDKAAGEILEINEQQYDSGRLEELATMIRGAANQMKE